MQGDYDYTSSGFDGFLSRSIDDLSQTNLDSAGPRSTAMRFDSAQLSGYLGDTFQAGGTLFTKKGIISNDGENDFFLLGDE